MATKLEEYLGRTPAAPPKAMTDEAAPLYRTEQPAPVPAPEPVTPTTDYAKLIADKGYFGAFQELYPKQDLTQEYNRTKKKQQMALLADIANVGSQLFASSRGARKFTPVQSQVPAYEDRMQRLRDAQRAYDADYAGKSLSAAYKDYTDKQAQDWKEKQLDAQREAAANKLAQDLMKFNANLTYKQAKDAADRELQKRRNAETKRHNEEMEKIARQRVKQSNDSANKVVEMAYGGDGKTYVRNTPFSDATIRQLADKWMASLTEDELAPFIKEKVEKVYPGMNVKQKEYDYKAIVSHLLSGGYIPSSELVKAGFVLAPGQKEGLGWGTETSTDNETDW